MLTIDNGDRKALSVPGIFLGTAGVQGRRVAFIPNIKRGKPTGPVSALLDGAAVNLVFDGIGNGLIYSATFTPAA